MRYPKLQSLAFAAMLAMASAGMAETLTLIHTNDTHSSIEPDAKSGTGGAVRRKVLIDSIRSARPNSLLIDAGDAFQGSLYFMLFGGEVETALMNDLGYDMAIPGNHEFDNGSTRLATLYRSLEPELLSSNYDFTDSPLDGLFLPYSIRQEGGRRIAFIGLNVNPDQLIDSANIAGIRYRDAITVANNLAQLLKQKEKADMVVAISHLGYDSEGSLSEVNDRNLAARSSDIDIIIGGHSHTSLRPDDPRTLIPNLRGDTVLVVQTGSKGSAVGQIDIDLATLRPTYKLHSVNARLDRSSSPSTQAIIDRYKGRVDSIASIRIGQSSVAMDAGSERQLNLASDIVLAMSRMAVEGLTPDLAIMNRGGLRNALPKGVVTKGDIMNIFPFDNRLTIVQMTGTQLQELLDCMAERPTVAGVSDGVKGRYAGNKAVDVSVNGTPIDPARIYNVATIDYLAKGNDYLTPFRKGNVVYRSPVPVFNEIIDYVIRSDKKGIKLNSPSTPRISAKL